MNAITVQQPWATLIREGLKDIEFRTWKPPPEGIGKDLAIHASKQWTQEAAQWVADVLKIHIKPDEVDYGCIAAVVTLAGVQREEHGTYAWILTNIRPVPHVIECSGAQRIWKLPKDVEAAVRADLKGVRALALDETSSAASATR